MEGNPAPGRMTPPVQTMESVPTPAPTKVEPPPIPEPSITQPSVETTQVEIPTPQDNVASQQVVEQGVQKTLDNLTGEQVKEQLDMRWDRLTNPATGLLWKNESGDINNLLRNDIAAYEKALKENPDLVKRGIYRQASNEPGKPPLSEKTNSDLIARVLEECEKNPDNQEVQTEFQALQEHVLVHNVPGENGPLTLEQWKEKGKPAGEFRFKAEGTKPAETQPANQTSEVKSPEAAETREAYLNNARGRLRTLYLAAQERIGWRYSKIPSENERMIAANKGYPKELIKDALPGVDVDRMDSMSDDAILQHELFQLERQIRAYESAATTLNPAQTERLKRLKAEHGTVRGYMSNPDTIDFSLIDKEFEKGGILETPAQRGEFIGNILEIESQMQKLEAQGERYDSRLRGSLTLPNGTRIEVTQDDINSWGKNLAMVGALSAMLLFLEGEKEKPQAGGGMPGHP